MSTITPVQCAQDETSMIVDVLCLGHASYDLTFSVPHHPEADEKTVADAFTSGGGGPAANAAVAAARLGYRAAFAGYLGHDVFGDRHVRELEQAGVNCDLVVRGAAATPLSAILVQPDGRRALVNYRQSNPLQENAVDFSGLQPKIMLFDGHEPNLSLPLADHARKTGIPTVLDAGSLHAGSEALMSKVDYLVCSEKFARQLSCQADARQALSLLSKRAPNVVITLGKFGIVWQNGKDSGEMPAFKVHAVDTTGAGDAFHGAFAAALADDQPWLQLLRFASAAAALSCTGAGARSGLPGRNEVKSLLKENGLRF
ncbi:MAG: PfkB family carbohydrate kinase [Mariprofundaceae bacterium]